MESPAYDYVRIQDDEESEKATMQGEKLFRPWLRQNMGFILFIVIALLWATTGLIKINHDEINLSTTDDSSQVVWMRYGWWSKYSTNDHLNITATREVDRAWDDIVPGHGVVAIDHQWAADQGLPLSMNLPDDHSKGVYILDAYHQIHCLTIIRKTLYQLERKEPVTWPAGHTIHCFDALRQYIMCTGGDTLLYTKGRNKTGDGQFRRCKNWATLRDWATAHTACYRDSETSIPLEDHFGYCDNGDDGLSWAPGE